MDFVLNGTIFRINNLQPSVDKAFLDLHASYFGNHCYDLDSFKSEAIVFFTSAINDTQKQDSFFNNLTIIWRKLLNESRFDEASALWEFTINIALDWEQKNKGQHIHKGTPYYFWGMTTIIRGDIDQGYALMHQALEEDVRTLNNPFPDSPGLAFTTLDYKKVDQAFRDWVLQLANHLNSILNINSSKYGGNLPLSIFRKKLLSSPPNRDIMFLFAHTVAKFYKFGLMPKHSLSSDFAGQLEMNLFFNIALVIDAVIKNKNTGKNQFIDHAAFLSKKCHLNLTKSRLREINKDFNNDFEGTLNQLLDDKYISSGGLKVQHLSSSLAITYGIRNRGAHNISSVSTIWKRFEDIKQHIFNTLFISIEKLY
ncbi:MAG: hypothetical protein GXO85_09885 [Chlorobi bacterium]|nr:hypothetical protein [Chlorobiota bacterium]